MTEPTTILSPRQRRQKEGVSSPPQVVVEVDQLLVQSLFAKNKHDGLLEKETLTWRRLSFLSLVLYCVAIYLAHYCLDATWYTFKEWTWNLSTAREDMEHQKQVEAYDPSSTSSSSSTNNPSSTPATSSFDELNTPIVPGPTAPGRVSGWENTYPALVLAAIILSGLAAIPPAYMFLRRMALRISCCCCCSSSRRRGIENSNTQSSSSSSPSPSSWSNSVSAAPPIFIRYANGLSSVIGAIAFSLMVTVISCMEGLYRSNWTEKHNGWHAAAGATACLLCAVVCTCILTTPCMYTADASVPEGIMPQPTVEGNKQAALVAAAAAVAATSTKNNVFGMHSSSSSAAPISTATSPRRGLANTPTSSPFPASPTNRSNNLNNNSGSSGSSSSNVGGGGGGNRTDLMHKSLSVYNTNNASFQGQQHRSGTLMRSPSRTPTRNHQILLLRQQQQQNQQDPSVEQQESMQPPATLSQQQQQQQQKDRSPGNGGFQLNPISISSSLSSSSSSSKAQQQPSTTINRRMSGATLRFDLIESPNDVYISITSESSITPVTPAPVSPQRHGSNIVASSGHVNNTSSYNRGNQILQASSPSSRSASIVSLQSLASSTQQQQYSSSSSSSSSKANASNNIGRRLSGADLPALRRPGHSSIKSVSVDRRRQQGGSSVEPGVVVVSSSSSSSSFPSSSSGTRGESDVVSPLRSAPPSPPMVVIAPISPSNITHANVLQQRQQQLLLQRQQIQSQEEHHHHQQQQNNIRIDKVVAEEEDTETPRPSLLNPCFTSSASSSASISPARSTIASSSPITTAQASPERFALSSTNFNKQGYFQQSLHNNDNNNNNSANLSRRSSIGTVASHFTTSSLTTTSTAAAQQQQYVHSTQGLAAIHALLAKVSASSSSSSSSSSVVAQRHNTLESSNLDANHGIHNDNNHNNIGRRLAFLSTANASSSSSSSSTTFLAASISPPRAPPSGFASIHTNDTNCVNESFKQTGGHRANSYDWDAFSTDDYTEV